METIYFISAIVGGSILVLQVILILVGASGAHADTGGGHFDVHDHVDVHPDVDGDASSAFFKVLSLKTLVAFFTFFGLSGMACTHSGVGSGLTLAISLASGSAALYIVAWMMAGMAKLESSGNLDLRNAVGIAGKVYLTIPAAHSGRGKVTVAVQGRTVEAKATTGGGSLTTGTMIKVIGVPAPDTLEVVALIEKQED